MSLRHTWTIWEVRASNAADGATTCSDYGESIHAVGSFSDLETFWAYWSRLPRLSALFSDGVSSEYRKGVCRTKLAPTVGPAIESSEVVVVDGFAVFREGVKPAWEDPANNTGGEWCCRKGNQR